MVCPTCRTQHRAAARFCTQCGTSVVPAPAAGSPPSTEPAGWMQRLARLFGAKPAVPVEPVAPVAEVPPGPFPGTTSRDIPSNPFPPARPRSTPADATPEALPYRLNDKFLTRAEASFFRVLQLALPDGVLLCPKVNLQDLFWAPPHDYTARNRIDRKHVDFVLADAETLRPVCGIELDDRSHQRPDRQERDRFVEGVFAAAGLPLVRVPVSAGYDPEELGAALRAAIVQAPRAPDPHSVTHSASPPPCPKCRIPMVVRTTKRGGNVGQKFFGCSNYPRCHEIIQLTLAG